MLAILAWIFVISTFIFFGFSAARYAFIKNNNDSHVRKNVYELVYKNGVVVDGKVTDESNFIITILKIIDDFFGQNNSYLRAISYEFVANDGNKYTGACIANLWLEPYIFFAANGKKIKVIYTADDPTINLIYTDIKNIKYG